jgi:hypothetical protein
MLSILRTIFSLPTSIPHLGVHRSRSHNFKLISEDLPGAIIATATTQRLQRKSKLINIMDGTYTYRNSSSTKALSTTNDGAPRFSASEYQYGRHTLGAAYQHHSLCSRHRT